MTEIQRILATNLRRLRNERKLTQEKLAKKAGITSTSVVHLENGQSWLRPPMLSAIAKALEVPEAEFFRDPDLVTLPPLPVAVSVLNEVLNRYQDITEKIPLDLLTALLDQDEFGLSQVQVVLDGFKRAKSLRKKGGALNVRPLNPKR